MSEPDKIKKVLEMSEWVLQFGNEKIDYQKIADDFYQLVEAKFVALNLFDDSGTTFTTAAVSGDIDLIHRVSEQLGSSLAGRIWLRN